MNTELLATVMAEGFDVRNIRTDNDLFLEYQELASDILANPEQLRLELPYWYCRGMCFADYIQCIAWNPNYPPRAICDVAWENCIKDCKANTV
jgi:hypothetical protein